MTYSFYRVNKTQTIRFTLLSVNREVADPIGRVSIDKVDRAFIGLTATVPHMVLSTDPERLEQESTDRRSEVRRPANTMQERSRPDGWATRPSGLKERPSGPPVHVRRARRTATRGSSPTT